MAALSWAKPAVTPPIAKHKIDKIIKTDRNIFSPSKSYQNCLQAVMIQAGQEKPKNILM
jgi:hypothetical protein